jgi:hypothetical protein
MFMDGVSQCLSSPLEVGQIGGRLDSLAQSHDFLIGFPRHAAWVVSRYYQYALYGSCCISFHARRIARIAEVVQRSRLFVFFHLQDA